MAVQHSAVRFIKYIILFLCAGFIITYFQNYSHDLEHLKNIRIKDILILLIYTSAFQLLTAYKFYYLLKNNKIKNMSLRSLLSIFVLSRFVNLFILQGGNIYRGMVLKHKYNFPYTNSISIMTVFTWLDSVFSIILSILIIIVSQWKFNQQSIILLFIILFLIILILLPLFGKLLVTKIPASSHKKLAWFQFKLKTLFEQVALMIKDYKLLVTFAFLTCITYSLFLLQIHYAFSATAHPINAAQSAAFGVTTILSIYINITPNNLGVTELLYGLLGQSFTLSLGLGILVCAILRVIWVMVICLLTLFFIPDLISDLKHIRLFNKNQTSNLTEL